MDNSIFETLCGHNIHEYQYEYFTLDTHLAKLEFSSDYSFQDLGFLLSYQIGMNIKFILSVSTSNIVTLFVVHNVIHNAKLWPFVIHNSLKKGYNVIHNAIHNSKLSPFCRSKPIPTLWAKLREQFCWKWNWVPKIASYAEANIYHNFVITWYVHK